MRLYDLTEQYNDIANMLESSDDREALQTMLDGLEGEIEAKIESCIKLWRSKIGERDFIKNERMRLEQREKRIDNAAEWLLQYVEREMKKLGIESVPSKLFTIALQNNPPSCEIIDEKLIPQQWMRTMPETIVPDKRGMLDLMKTGVEIPGAKLKQEKRLQVR